jgi:hypothetical protein
MKLWVRPDKLKSKAKERQFLSIMFDMQSRRKKVQLPSNGPKNQKENKRLSTIA